MFERNLITASQKGNIEPFSQLVELYQQNVRACPAPQNNEKIITHNLHRI